MVVCEVKEIIGCSSCIQCNPAEANRKKAELDSALYDGLIGNVVLNWAETGNLIGDDEEIPDVFVDQTLKDEIWRMRWDSKDYMTEDEAEQIILARRRKKR